MEQLKQKYDLIVAGGGITGVAAAVAAAREGLQVCIIEQYGFLGGAATNSQVNPFMPYSIIDQDKRTLVNAGVFKTIVDRLDAWGGLHENRDTFNEEFLKLILDRMAREHHIDVLFHSYIIDASMQGKNVESVTVVNKSGKTELRANYFIDCTGDADLSVMAGCEYQLGRETDSQCQPMTLCFRLGNVDIEKFNKVRPTITPLYRDFQKAGKIQNQREDVLIFSHMCEGVLHFNSTRIVKRNPVDAVDVSIAEMEAREQVFELYNFMKDHIEGFENCTLLMSAPQIGVRESRMVKGLYVITGEDLISCTKFEDSIARGNYGIDIHNPDGTGTKQVFIPHGEYYTIPYRALIHDEVDNLITAGRCISSTHEAQSAYRVIPICCCMGEGAGTAAAVACQGGTSVKNVSVEKVRERLVKNGALV